jgi:mono/diheme cytochrome c family protein
MRSNFSRGESTLTPQISKILVLSIALCGLLSGIAAHAADDATVKVYQTKCAACHGADGSGNTTVGKALKLKDIRDPEAQKASDADLTTLIAKGKDKMPGNEKTLKPEQIKSLVAYVRELAQKK